MMRTGKGILKNIISVSGVVLLTKFLGFAKQIVSAKYFGASIQTDLISISEGLISNLDYLLVQSLSTAFVPIYLSVKIRNESCLTRFVSDCIKVLFIVTAFISGIIFVSAPTISKLLAPTYSVQLTTKLTHYIRILSPALIAVAEMALFNSLLKANEHFIQGELIGFNQSIIFFILVLTIGSVLGADTLIVAFLCYAIFNLFFLMIQSRKLWFITRGNPFTNEDIKKLIKMMGPLLLGYSVVFVNQQVDKIIVSGLQEGTITAMGYAAVLSNFVTTFASSLCIVLFTYVTEHIVKSENREAASLIKTSMCQMVTLLIPISTLTLTNANDIVSIVFGGGKFDRVAVNNCAIALAGYALMFVPFVVRELTSRFQYAYGDSKMPMINSSISIIFNILCSILFSRIWGVFGVTLATSISVAICAVLNYKSSTRRNSSLFLEKRMDVIIRWMIGIVVCVGTSIIGRYTLDNTDKLVRFCLISLLSFVLYFVITFPVIKPLLVGLRNSK